MGKSTISMVIFHYFYGGLAYQISGHHLDPEDSVLASKFSCLLSRCVAKNTK